MRAANVNGAAMCHLRLCWLSATDKTIFCCTLMRGLTAHHTFRRLPTTSCCCPDIRFRIQFTFPSRKPWHANVRSSCIWNAFPECAYVCYTRISRLSGTWKRLHSIPVLNAGAKRSKSLGGASRWCGTHADGVMQLEKCMATREIEWKSSSAKGVFGWLWIYGTDW